METLERPTFETETGKRIYQHVERHGTTSPDEIRDAVALPSEEFDAQVQRLKARGYLEEQNGDLALAFDVGAEEDHETEDVAYTVRPARDEDFEGLVDTIRAVTAKETYVIGERIAEQLRYDETIARHNTVRSRLFFVATVDEYAVGWSHLDLPQVEKLQDTAQLTVGVREDYRGYGIGERLLERALEWADANGFRKAYNSVAATNGNAITFLESQGWEREAVRSDHYTVDGRPVDEVMMAYTF